MAADGPNRCRHCGREVHHVTTRAVPCWIHVHSNSVYCNRARPVDD